jgi:hypothetical protein
MSLFLLPVVISVFCPFLAHAKSNCASNDQAFSDLGEWSKSVTDVFLDQVIERLRAKGFVCLDVRGEPDSARRCVGRIPGYSKKVAVYIPVHYQPGQRDPGMITHFQGHSVDSTFEHTLARYRLGNELHRSGMNKLLVVPESTGRCDTYRAELLTGAQFEGFQGRLQDLFQEVGLFAKDPELGTVTREITGHSGAYYPIGNILRSACGVPGPVLLDGRCLQVKQVALFDATYCSAGNLSARVPEGSFNENTACQGLRSFAAAHSPKLRSYFRDPSGTSTGSRLILPKADPEKEALGGACTGRVPVPSSVPHLNVMTGRYAEAISEDFSESCILPFVEVK